MFSRPWPTIKARPKPQPRPQPEPAVYEQGGCECGDVTVKLLGVNFQDGPQGKLCHCYRCRQLASSHYRHNITVAAKQLVIEGSGTLTSFKHEVVPGQTNRLWFCARCGCDVASKDEERLPGHYFVPLGIFDHTPHPTGELVSWQKVGWLRDKFELKELDE